MKIASEQKKNIDRLRDTLTKVEGSVGRDARPAFQAIRARLDDWSARIAVIGQVKAGKSTFMNAFLGYQDLLPSDVNPWTSVVTNVRINGPHDPESGARFEFFNEGDWAEIMDGNSRVRKLAEQLLPGFDSEILRRQSEEMRERARLKLGRHYQALLGSQHDYDFVTPDLLKRYVCSGMENEAASSSESVGRYSLLTKVAQVYLRRSDFQVPTILTDTPGVNDPFLVRDEFTCRSLDHSEVFIVVLSAHQALTEVDIALIRILAEQDSKDVMIFINRIDELDDYVHSVPRVLDDVINRLLEAIPDIEFTVVPGSAYLAELALRDDDEALRQRQQYDTPRLAAYLEDLYGIVPQTTEDRLYLASGLDALKFTLSNIIDSGTGCRKLQQFQQDIRSEIGGIQFATKRERLSIQNQIEKIATQRPTKAAEAISAELQDLESTYTRVTELFEQTSTQIDKIITKSWSGLEQSLNAAIDEFVADQKAVLNERVLRSSIAKQASQMLTISTAKLNETLNKESRSKYGKSRAGTDVVLSNCLSAFESIVGNYMDGLGSAITLRDLPNEEFVTTLTLSKKSLELGIVFDRGWAFWQRPKINVVRSLEALRLLAAAELRPPVEKLLKAYNEAQVERASAGLDRLRVLLRSLELSISERRHRLMRDRRQLEQIDPESQRQLVERLQSQLEVLERRLQALSISDSALADTILAAAA